MGRALTRHCVAGETDIVIGNRHEIAHRLWIRRYSSKTALISSASAPEARSTCSTWDGDREPARTFRTITKSSIYRCRILSAATLRDLVLLPFARTGGSKLSLDGKSFL